ncbi:MAG: DUF2185 domain-containing protein [Paracoccaceae bacterium]
MFDQTPDDFERGGNFGWRLLDPRPIHRENPYTFFLPSEAEKSAVEEGDIVKLAFESLDPDNGAIERMWVIYRGQDGDGWYGDLDNEPYDIEGLHLGDRIYFQSHHIYSVWDLKIDTADDEKQYFSRCHVDQRIIDGEADVVTLERRKPKRLPWWKRRREKYPDSGWFIFASAEEHAQAKFQYVAVAVVLNQDDGFIDLLEAPVGSRIVKENGAFRMD